MPGNESEGIGVCAPAYSAPPPASLASSEPGWVRTYHSTSDWCRPSTEISSTWEIALPWSLGCSEEGCAKTAVAAAPAARAPTARAAAVSAAGLPRCVRPNMEVSCVRVGSWTHSTPAPSGRSYHHVEML